MIYYTDEARDCATEHINKIFVKLAELKPNDEYLTSDDIREALHYLRVLKDALYYEQLGVDRERVKIARGKRNRQKTGA